MTPPNLEPNVSYWLIEPRASKWVQLVDGSVSYTNKRAFASRWRWPFLTHPEYADFLRAYGYVIGECGEEPFIVRKG